MLDAFYGAFSPACFALLGLWLVVVQMRADELRVSRELSSRAYAIALFFALPGLMGVIALVDPANPAFWRSSFAIIALAGAGVLFAVHGLPGAARIRDVANAAAVVLYLAIAVLAVIGGAVALRTEAVLLTALLFLGFNIAWLLVFAPLAPARETTRQEPYGSAAAASETSRPEQRVTD